MKKVLVSLLVMAVLFTGFTAGAQTSAAKTPAEKAAAKEKEKADKAKEKADKAAAKEKEKADKTAAKEKEKADKAAAKEKEKADKAAAKAKTVTTNPPAVKPTPTPAPTPSPTVKANPKPVTQGVNKSPDKAVGTDAKGRTIYEGPKGGRYTLTAAGNKEYIKKN